MKTLICIVGRNSTGKTTIAKKIAKEFRLKLVQSYTTRPPRNSEKQSGLENSDHIFISESEFDEIEKKPENIAAATVINGVRYCTTIDILRDSDIYVIDPDGVKDLKEKFGKEFHIIQFYIYAENDIRKNRYISRGETETAFCKRDESEAAQFNKYETSHEYDIVIYNNGDIDDAVRTISSYVSIIMEKSPEANDNNAECTEKVDCDNSKHNNAEIVTSDTCHSQDSKEDEQSNNRPIKPVHSESDSVNDTNINKNDVELFSRFSVDNEEGDKTTEVGEPKETNDSFNDDEDIIVVE